MLIHAHAGLARARALAGAIAAAGGSAEAFGCDLRDVAATEAAVARLLDAGVPQIVVHNAGTHDDAPMAGMRAEQWQSVIDVSLGGFYAVLRPLLLPLIGTRWGRVVAVSSVSALLGNRGQVNYAAAKAGLIGAVKSLAREVASRGHDGQRGRPRRDRLARRGRGHGRQAHRRDRADAPGRHPGGGGGPDRLPVLGQAPATSPARCISINGGMV